MIGQWLVRAPLLVIGVAVGLSAAMLMRASVAEPRVVTPPMESKAPHDPAKHKGHGTHGKHSTPAKPDTPPPSTEPDPTPKPAASASLAKRVVDAGYRDLGNATCPVMGNASDGDDPTFIAYNGALVRFCCPGCDRAFLESPIEQMRTLADAGVKLPDGWDKPAAHPEVVHASNARCPVTDADVTASKTIAVHRGVVVRLKDADALVAFAGAPDRYLAKAAESGTVPADRIAKESNR